MSQLLFMLFGSLEAAIHIQGEKRELESLLSIELLLETLLPPPDTVHCRLSTLRIINLYLSCINFKNMKDSKKVSLAIYESLKNNLAAPHHLVWFNTSLSKYVPPVFSVQCSLFCFSVQVREMTCRIFCLLPLAPEIQSMFRICLEAEMIACTVTDYRDKYQLLQKLSFDMTQSIFVKHVDYRSVWPSSFCDHEIVVIVMVLLNSPFF